MNTIETVLQLGLGAFIMTGALIVLALRDIAKALQKDKENDE